MSWVLKTERRYQLCSPPWMEFHAYFVKSPFSIVNISGSNLNSYIHLCTHACSLSHVWLLATAGVVTHQAYLSMEFSRQENWSGLPFPTLLLLVLSRFSCIRLCDRTDGSLPGSPIPGILQARTLEWVAIYSAAAAAAANSLQSCLTLCDPRDGSPPGSPSLGFSRQEHWSRLPLPSPMHESEKWKWSRSVVSDS